MDAKYSTIEVKKEELTTTVILNRPNKGNALTHTMFSELNNAIEVIAEDDTARVVILTGAGRFFCTGGDLSDNPLLPLKRPEKQRDRLKRVIHRTCLGLMNLEKPVIAAVNGPAIGAGCDLALVCDIRIAAENAQFGEVYVKVGAIPDCGGTWLLPRLVGISKACELIFTGDIIDAKEAERIGLVNKVVPEEDLEREVKSLASKISAVSPIAVSIAKSTIYKGLNSDFAVALGSIADGMSICLQTDDLHEGFRAFQEKRKPQFKGR